MVEVGPVTDAVLPAGVEAIADLAPVDDEAGQGWLVLDAGGVISRWDPAAGTCRALAAASVPGEPGHQAWCGHDLRRRLHASAAGVFAAVVNDYGRLGEVIDLRAGRVTMALDNGGGHAETVPFSLAFARHHGQDVVIHRTAWNRLDVSEAASGRLLTARETGSYRSGKPRPDHYLDYFHGALHLSPDGTRILDDGWFWHPVGIPVAWELAAWLDHGPEGRFFSDGTTLISSSEDGLSLWDPLTGTRTAFTPAFTPAYYHPAARELLEISGGGLRRARHT